MDAETGDRISVGAQLEPLINVERFLSLIRFDQRGKLDQLGIELSTLDAKMWK